MSRHGLIACLAPVVFAGCSAVGGLLGPNIDRVEVGVPFGMLVGDTAFATSNAVGDDGKTHNGRPVKWSSSDPAALPIDAQGRMVAKTAGRTVTITAEVDGTKGSATVTISSDDTRFAYTLADQPDAAGPYTPAASTSFNSSGGTISVTRTSVGVYTVRFAGLGRHPGGRDNVQVSAYGATSPIYCKPQLWDGTGADMVVPVNCLLNTGVPADSKFTILLIGARPFGATTPLGFSYVLGYPDVTADTSVFGRNSTGGPIQIGYISEGNYAQNFVGLGLASGGASGPVGILVSPVGAGPRRCLLAAYALAEGGLAYSCEKLGGDLADTNLSVLWFTRGRPGFRYGYAWVQGPTGTPVQPPPELRGSSSGGVITSRSLGTGTIQVVFPGLARGAGATETVVVSAFGRHLFCGPTSWTNTGTSDLSVNVACWNTGGTAQSGSFNILVIQ